MSWCVMGVGSTNVVCVVKVFGHDQGKVCM